MSNEQLTISQRQRLIRKMRMHALSKGDTAEAAHLYKNVVYKNTFGSEALY